MRSGAGSAGGQENRESELLRFHLSQSCYRQETDTPAVELGDELRQKTGTHFQTSGLDSLEIQTDSTLPG